MKGSLRWKTHAVAQSLLHCSVDRGLQAGGQDYQRFIILGRSRTGSTLLLKSLKEHRQLLCFGEIFRNDTLNWQPQFGWASDQQIGAYLADPEHFLAERVFRKHPASIRAVGFKLFYYHAQTAQLRSVWEYLQQDRTLKVIHVKRRNILATHLSRALAGETDRWRASSNKGMDAKGAIELTYEECLEAFEQTRAWEEQCDVHFAAQARLDVLYEDLAHNFAGTMVRVQEFLGLEVSQLTPALSKQAQRPLSMCIANFAELKEQFAATRWAEFFVE